MARTIFSRRRARHHSVADITGVVMVVVVMFGAALFAGWQPQHLGKVVGVIVVLTVTLVVPRFVLVIALIATFFPQRIGPAAIDLSVTDALATWGAITALRFVPWRDPRLRLVLTALAFYLFTLAVAVVAHPGGKAVLEWAHRGMLFGGAILVGVALVQTGTTKIALRVFLIGSALAATVTIAATVANGFEPTDAGGLNKNHMGIMLAAAFLVLLTVKARIAWPPWVVLGLKVLVLVGLAATQSRGCAIGLVAAIALRGVLQSGQGRRRQFSIAVLVLCGAVIALTFVSVSTRDLSRDQAGQKYNAINTRLDVVDTTLADVWRPSPIMGGGLRFWSDLDRGLMAPHNLVVGELGEAGVVGLVGLVALCAATIVALRRGRSDLATMGLMVFVLRLTQGTADIFWVAGPLTVALILAGMGVSDGPDAIDGSGEPVFARRGDPVTDTAVTRTGATLGAVLRPARPG